MLTAITGINWGDEGKGRMVTRSSTSSVHVLAFQSNPVLFDFP